MKMKCPSCAHEINVAATVVIPDSQRVTVEMRSEDATNEMFAAHTVGELILRSRNLLKAVAKDLDANVDVFVSKMLMEPGLVSIEFSVVTVKKAAKK